MCKSTQPFLLRYFYTINTCVDSNVFNQILLLVNFEVSFAFVLTLYPRQVYVNIISKELEKKYKKESMFVF